MTSNICTWTPRQKNNVASRWWSLFRVRVSVLPCSPFPITLLTWVCSWYSWHNNIFCCWETNKPGGATVNHSVNKHFEVNNNGGRLADWRVRSIIGLVWHWSDHFYKVIFTPVLRGGHISNLKKIFLSILKIWASKLSKKFHFLLLSGRLLDYWFCKLFKIVIKHSITLKFGTTKQHVKANFHTKFVWTW